MLPDVPEPEHRLKQHDEALQPDCLIEGKQIVLDLQQANGLPCFLIHELHASESVRTC